MAVPLFQFMLLQRVMAATDGQHRDAELSDADTSKFHELLFELACLAPCVCLAGCACFASGCGREKDISVGTGDLVLTIGAKNHQVPLIDFKSWWDVCSRCFVDLCDSVSSLVSVSYADCYVLSFLVSLQLRTGRAAGGFVSSSHVAQLEASSSELVESTLHASWEESPKA